VHTIGLAAVNVGNLARGRAVAKFTQMLWRTAAVAPAWRYLVFHTALDRPRGYNAGPPIAANPVVDSATVKLPTRRDTLSAQCEGHSSMPLRQARG